MATKPAETLKASGDPKPKVSKLRKRAPKACLSCRSRKVRCDWSQRGPPCSNCYLDNENCVVTGRASRFRRSKLGGPLDMAPISQSYLPGATRPDHSHSPDHQDTAFNVDGSQHNHNANTPSPKASSLPQELSNPLNETNLPKDFGANARPEPKNHTPTDFNLPFSGSPVSQWLADQRTNFQSDIVYSYYSFVHIGNLSSILPQDVNYLELQGCLRLPTRPTLDEFVRQYFLHVHPMLPLTDEGDFWELYYGHGARRAAPDVTQLSLLVFQSMLFASCNFVSRATIKSLGYPDIHTARAALYRRAKLLYDFETETCPIALSQASVLLSFWSPPSTQGAKKANTGWLTSAINHAKAADAHHYSALPTFSPSASPVQHKKQNTLKRLWWSVIIRDRVLPLGMRRSIQITRDHFPFEANPQLTVDDLMSEIERSKVYNSLTKKSLVVIFIQLVELAVLLSDILVLVYPLDDSPWRKSIGPDEVEKIRGCKIALRRWFRGTTTQFPVSGAGNDTAGSRGDGSSDIASNMNAAGHSSMPRAAAEKEFQHDSVILYTNLMYMYYHSARVALCHFSLASVSQSLVGGHCGGATRVQDASLSNTISIHENRHELQDAASGVTECLKELIQLKLARWLPVSAVACTALPLVLHIMDVKLSGPALPGTGGASDDPFDRNNSQTALKQHRLNILIEAMKTYHPQYDGVEWVSQTIRHILSLAQLDSARSGQLSIGSGGGGISDWTDILASHPSFYLRLALTMDLSLSKGRLPEDCDFPVGLRGLFDGGINPLVELIRRARMGDVVGDPMDLGGETPRRNPVMTMPMGSVVPILSDEDTNSPGSRYHHSSPNGSMDEDEAREHVAGHFAPMNHVGLDIQMGESPFSELAAEVLAALPGEDHSLGSEEDDVFGDRAQSHDPTGWVEQVWHREEEQEARMGGGGNGDHETAQALLDAIQTES
ncbi:Cutinase transcription factor 1 beta [Zalerion maritima]|uniref:Cutinase transcription factor 1 beta n=1 Tax=Zalerion maritima TaxID=339359 RepID=A0AAD5RI31_9PEZI|nr:Cutinase transcription factor 1 beta [Zalerion maritima]